MSIVKIIETGATQSLAILDPKTGLDYSGDLLGNYDGYDGYDEDSEMPTMTQETYNWWADLLGRLESAEYAAYEYRRSIDDQQDFDDLLSQHTNCDLENIPEAIISAIGDHRACL